MSAHDDDDVGGEDAQLKQLRSVWVSMRETEEDPPDGGLASLMSAARAKAAEMAVPEDSWWQRALAVFRRPPVLALASVTVLLGGALVIAQRHDSMKAESTIYTERQREVSAEPRNSVAHGSGAGSSAAAPATVSVPAEQPAASPPPPPPPPPPQPNDEHEPTRNAVQPTRPPARPRPGGATSSAPVPGEKLQDGEGVVGGAIASPDLDDVPASPDKPEVAPVQTNATPTRGPVAKRPMPVDAPTTEAADAPKAPTTETKVKTNAKDGDSFDSGRLAQVRQLVKQCESAAARGDCPAVRALAKRILSTDAGVYKQRVATNSSIVRCLE